MAGLGRLGNFPRAAFQRLRPLAVGILCLGVPGFMGLAWLVMTQGHQNGLDTQATEWALQSRSPALTQALLLITNLHSVMAISVYTVGLSVCLWVMRGHRHWLLPLWLFFPAGSALNVLLKHGFARPRPGADEALLHLATFSFPSGHASGTTLLYGFFALVVLVHVRGPGWRWVTGVAALLVIGLVCWSRVYLGVHFLTDVLAGVVEALVWMALCVIALSARSRPTC
ncbi:phosphatase PAP2 family protein [Aquabacterium sp.]|uniref:phosphatase PAP2 family protein n=1 Tax=Aquabacterium sp. TaxID=1872578 RepID=UPI0024876AD6|nr:phosphatase PAP2 family protein [Aquabacterium sp.]MDI1257755.1 phosphatase PAP2 family protein [Aquabacterium sp.]